MRGFSCQQSLALLLAWLPHIDESRGNKYRNRIGSENEQLLAKAARIPFPLVPSSMDISIRFSYVKCFLGREKTPNSEYLLEYFFVK